eukprot:TRINITY_DN24912_c0_g1_i1.p2 TRINITY_DN24912_c0_g1~~TRINITY_DN24912_c0_g1_i1.p2  ORF type:complete len:115 (-),score=4.41 TRINITY_DN24912_c0_g1_i1:167-511(-)
MTGLVGFVRVRRSAEIPQALGLVQGSQYGSGSYAPGLRALLRGVGLAVVGLSPACACGAPRSSGLTAGAAGAAMPALLTVWGVHRGSYSATASCRELTSVSGCSRMEWRWGAMT